MDLVATLKAQHRMMEEIAGRLGEHLATGDAPRIRLTIEELRQTLRAHTDLEDARLYGPLLSSTAADEASLAMANDFSRGISPVAESLRLLSLHHTEGAIDPDAIAPEWAAIAHALAGRVEAEEASLFPLFQRVVGKNGLLRRAGENRNAARGAA